MGEPKHLKGRAAIQKMSEFVGFSHSHSPHHQLISIGKFHELKLQKAKELLLLIMLTPFLHSRNYHLRLQKAAKGRPLKSAMGTCATCPRVLSNVRWPTLIQRASKTHCTNEEKRGKLTDFLRQSGIHLKRSEKVK